jgi:tetratricopeptide (TPR) repeat protein
VWRRGLKPDVAEAYHNRGVARRDKGNLDGALKDYAEAILKPDYANTYYNRAGLLKSKGQREMAIIDYQMAV